MLMALVDVAGARPACSCPLRRQRRIERQIRSSAALSFDGAVLT
jgi:hypothetical protein